MKYAVVLEKSPTSWGAFVPDLPGCVAVGESRPEVMELIREAIDLHVESLKASGEAVPAAHSETAYIEVAAG